MFGQLSQGAGGPGSGDYGSGGERVNSQSQSTASASAPTEHKGAAPRSIACAVVTISDTRTIATDKSGALIAQFLESAGHRIVSREIVPDEPDKIRPLLMRYGMQGDIAAVLMTGGTGISPRDRTFETVSAMLTKPLPGYGELFRMLSYQEIGSAALLSRAVGGLVGSMVVLTMPGSTAAVRLAMEKLVLPELGHIVREATKQ
jgi:molybdenum cofactor biosynthesis protein B